MNPDALKLQLVQKAKSLGCCAASVARARTPGLGAQRLDQWLANRFHGAMDYMSRTKPERKDLLRFQPLARSVLCIAVPYPLCTPGPPRKGDWGYVASYARGTDYHRVLREILGELEEFLRNKVKRDLIVTISVDSAPVLERSLAASCGLGRIGRNTALFVDGWGSRILLGELITDLDLPADNPLGGDLCGSCTACLDGCPTRALTADGFVDARRCLSYLTVEATHPIPENLQPSVGDRLFGCDTCQTLCPLNDPDRVSAGHAFCRSVGNTDGPARNDSPEAWLDLADLIGLGSKELKRRFAKTAMNRLSRARLNRNIAVVLGNTPPSERRLHMLNRLLNDPSTLVRTHAKQAIERIETTTIP